MLLRSRMPRLARPAFARRVWNLCTLFPALTVLLLLQGCPKRGEKIGYDEAERGLRLAINVNEAAYNSWHNLLDKMEQLHRQRRLSKARWASLKAIDGVIVATEADLIVGIEQAKKSLADWQHQRQRMAVMAVAPSALPPQQEQARQRFLAAIGHLLDCSGELREAYTEALLVTQAVTKTTYPLNRSDLKNLQSLVKMVDRELGPAQRSLSEQQERVLVATAPPSLARVAPQTSRLSSAARSLSASKRTQRKRTVAQKAQKP